MKLPLDLIKYSLSSFGNLRVTPKKEHYPNLSLPFLYEDIGREYHEATIVANAAKLPEKPSAEGIRWLICCGEPPKSYSDTKMNLIVLEQAADPSAILNCIQQCFLQYEEWENQLEQIVKDCGSMQELLDVSYSIFKNRLDITDAAHSVLASTERRLSSGEFPAPLGEITPQRFAEYQNLYADYRKKKGAFLWNDELSADRIASLQTVCVNLLDGELFVGAVTLLAIERPLHAHVFWLMERLAEYVRRIFLDDKRSEKPDYIVLLRDQLHSIIAGENPSKQLLSHLAGMADFTDKYSYRCLTVGVPKNSKEGYEKFLRKKILSILPESVVFLHEGSVTVIAKQPRNDDALLFAALDTLLASMELYAGVSDAFSDLSAARDYYREAKAARILSREDKSRPRIARFTDYSNTYLLQHSCGDLPAELFFPPGLQRIIEYDKSAHVSYVETLRIYLDAERNAAKAAKLLQISRNSLLTRLEKLESMLDMNLDDPDQRLRLNLCLRLMEK